MTIAAQDPIHLTFIGGGHLAQAIISGILSSTNTWTLNCDIAVTARRSKHIQELQSRYPQLLVTDNNLDQRIWEDSRISKRSSTQNNATSPILFLCTRPADVPTVAKQLAPILESLDPPVRPTVLQDWLPTGTAIIRSMPNTPVEVRQGATGLFASGDAKLRVNQVKMVLEEVSPLVTIIPEESMLDVVDAVSGIIALDAAIDTHERLYGSMANISAHTRFLAKRVYDRLSALMHFNDKKVYRIYQSDYGNQALQGPIIAFNLRNSRGEWVPKTEVEKLAALRNI
ncbi:hypothetical protein ACN42_g4753 [Penicillium freii]|uniref:Pyrroline-5-carboxylate reductase catalytic N-terminal domain-containing protein n=1 Tax=Penicillium freii TaxID=48697 RepID=A0A101MKQ2_PENFR|nr:hypothetical protein ACN42_g4753 [Penicillium freii]